MVHPQFIKILSASPGAALWVVCLVCLFTQRGPTPRIDGLPNARSFDNTSMVYATYTAYSEACEDDETSLVYNETAGLYSTTAKTLNRLFIIVTALGAMLSRLSSFNYGLLLSHGSRSSNFVQDDRLDHNLIYACLQSCTNFAW